MPPSKNDANGTRGPGEAKSPQKNPAEDAKDSSDEDAKDSPADEARNPKPAKTPRKRVAENLASQDEQNPPALKRKKKDSLNNKPVELPDWKSLTDQKDKDIVFLLACLQMSPLPNVSTPPGLFMQRSLQVC